MDLTCLFSACTRRRTCLCFFSLPFFFAPSLPPASFSLFLSLLFDISLLENWKDENASGILTERTMLVKAVSVGRMCDEAQ